MRNNKLNIRENNPNRVFMSSTMRENRTVTTIRTSNGFKRSIISSENMEETEKKLNKAFEEAMVYTP